VDDQTCRANATNCAELLNILTHVHYNHSSDRNDSMGRIITVTPVSKKNPFFLQLAASTVAFLRGCFEECSARHLRGVSGSLQGSYCKPCESPLAPDAH
jgi:hypothetical protein